MQYLRTKRLRRLYEKEKGEEEGGMNFNSKKYERREKKVIEKG